MQCFIEDELPVSFYFS